MGAVDRISYLPPNLTEHILQCLPLRDAVRTSILSTHWRFKWVFLPQLILDWSFFRSFFRSFEKLNKNGERDLVERLERLEYLNIVNHILLFHKGPISKFKVYIPYQFYDAAVSCWIHFVSCKLINKFKLFSNYETKLPSWMFSIVEFNHLTHLSLVNGSLPYVSRTFRGFPCLISLKFHLEEDAIKDVIATGQAIKLGIIVSKCPLLENLNIEIYDDKSCLTIHAPKLLNLVVAGFLSDIFLEETKRLKMLTLEHVVLDNKMNHERDVMEFFSRLPVVEKLILGFYFWENYFGKDYPINILNNNNHGNLRQLKNIVLKEVRLYNQCQWDALLCVFNMAPKLQNLKIEVDLGVYYEAEKVVGDCWLDHLKSVKIKLDGVAPDTNGLVLQLIKMILSSSPVLEVMTIKGSINDSAIIEKKLLRYRKSSANAKIILNLK